MKQKPTYEELEQKIRDLTQEAAQREQDYSALLINSLPGIFYLFDENGRFLRWNHNFENLSGYRSDEIARMTPLAFFEGKEKDYIAAQIKQVFEAGHADVEADFISKTGIRTPFYFNGQRVDIESKPYLIGMGIDITHRKQAEAALLESEEQYRILFENAGEAIFIAQEGMLKFTNKKTKELSGYSVEELMSIPFTEFIHEDDRSLVLDRNLKRLQGIEVPPSYAFRIIHKAGDVNWVELNAVIIEWRGEPATLIFLRDITERRRAESALMESEEKYRLIFENTPLGFLHFDQNGIITACNGGFVEIIGSSCEQLIGLNMLDLPDKNIVTAVTNALGGGHGFHEGWYHSVTADKVTWVKTLFEPLRNENGGVIGGVGIVEDITERKQIEDALRESEEKYRVLVEDINEIIFKIDANGVFTYISPVIADLGYDPDELMGRHFAEFIYPEDLDLVAQRFKKLMRGDIKPYEYRLLTKDGKTVWLRSSSKPMFANDRFLGLQGVATNISEEKFLKDQLQQAQKLEAIGTLAGGIAHDFNNILSAVIGYTELSLNKVSEETLLYQNLNSVLKAGLRAKDLVKQILTLSRREEQEKKPIAIIPLIKEVLKMLRSTIPASIDFKKNISSESLIVYADATQIHQVILNLVTNAVQAMTDREGLLRVLVEPISFEPGASNLYPDMEPGDYVHIEVSDTGMGIAETHLTKIFEPYFTTKEKGVGTGLGLSVVHGIVKAHQGNISVQSETGEGTSFQVYLPVAKNYSGEVAAQEINPLPAGNESILFVDDELAIVKMQQQSLEDLGYTVTTKSSSVEALELFQASPNRFDLLITDMGMPKLTGDKLASSVKEIRPDVSVILCTGFSEKFNGGEKNVAIDAFLMKPVDLAMMAKTVRGVLDKPK